jgi:hypothetical protein
MMALDFRKGSWVSYWHLDVHHTHTVWSGVIRQWTPQEVFSQRNWWSIIGLLGVPGNIIGFIDMVMHGRGCSVQYLVHQFWGHSEWLLEWASAKQRRKGYWYPNMIAIGNVEYKISSKVNCKI